LLTPFAMCAGFPWLGLLRGLRPARPHRLTVRLPCRRAGRTGEGRTGRFPRSLQIDRRVRRPAVPLRPRHGYAAVLHRGLPADNTSRPRSSPPRPWPPIAGTHRSHPISTRF